jgi:hypothetical protein
MSKNRNMQPAMTADLDQAWAEARQWLAESDPTEVYSLLQILDDDSPGRLLEAVQNLANLGLCEAHERLFAAMAAESQGKR